MTRLGDVVARVDALDGGLDIYAHRPWTADSEAHVGAGAAAHLERLCSVGEAREGLLHFDDAAPHLRVKRVIAVAEALRQARVGPNAVMFTYNGEPVGVFERGVPSGRGRYRFMPFRSTGHLNFATMLERGGRVVCELPDGQRFLVIARPEELILEVG